jgi:hypothetical protein
MRSSIKAHEIFTVFFGFLLSFFVLSAGTAAGECCGKLDAGLAYVRVDVLESGRTVHTMDMFAVRADGAYRICLGLCAKPSFLYAKSSGDQQLITGALGFGFCVPVVKRFTITPGVGLGLGYMSAEFNKSLFIPTLSASNLYSFSDGITIPLHIKEKFHSYSPYVFLEATYNFIENARICVNVQYAWSHTHTLFKVHNAIDSMGGPGFDFLNGWKHSKSKTEGFNYSALIERDFGDNWSINVGGAYSVSLSKEKHGLRAMGCKVGLAKWY